MCDGYYDGHYIDSGLPSEERERILTEGLKKNEDLNDWPEETE